MQLHGHFLSFLWFQFGRGVEPFESFPGQTPLKRRLPKFGFTNPNRQTYQLINLDRLEKLEQLTDGASLEMQEMLEMGLIRNTKTPVKLLGRGSLTKKIKITVDKASRGAVESVTQAGGEVIIPS